MKVSPKADYPVKVVHEPREHEPPVADLYEGVFAMLLNYVVNVTFVPDVSAAAPPWDDHLLPADFDEIASGVQARLVSAILGSYVVTPNETRADGEERFEWGQNSEFGSTSGVVFYVTPSDFARYAVDLVRLSEMNEDDFYARKTVSTLRGYDVVGFVERRVLASPWLLPRDAVMLGLASGAG
ncbi:MULTISPECIES: hypothetical protein [Protofrankia]|uniref:Uncharacterized protein n=1 Tax=Candidatus Protofrankia datiscae TaxID=2716812 RepID=F8B0W1_9ACTN|nr:MULTISPECIES: hypothetical protein [Protofrankia]AEH07782.1 hypothetical protein FsymDg_0210 [Candidatus Protofrankia datiscae]